MKKFKNCKIFPNIGNDRRQEVMDWCENIYGKMNADVPRWMSKSNYTYPLSYAGTFDIWFYDQKDANWFLLRWGGTIVETVYDEWYTSDEVVNTLFDFD